MMNSEILTWMFQFLDIEACAYPLNQKKVLDHFDESDRDLFFQALQAGFSQAVQASHLQKRFYTIGGYCICLSFAGEAMLRQITPAIAHLETNPNAHPDLNICLWDSASTQTQLPGLLPVFIRIFHWYWHEHLDGRQNVKALCSDRFSTRLNIGANVLSLLDHQQNLGLYWIDDAENLPYWEQGSPLQSILNWWLSARQRQYVHAAAVGMPPGGVLIAAKGGSGKSSSALACLNSPLSYASDDYCLISTAPSPYVYSLYSTAKLKGRDDFERFPKLAALCSNPEKLTDEKAMFFLQQHYPEKIVSGFPLRAILVPKITGEKDTYVQKATAIHALKALAPSTLLQLSGTGKSALTTMSTLVKELPCYSLELGTDIEQIPLVIKALLESLEPKAATEVAPEIAPEIALKTVKQRP